MAEQQATRAFTVPVAKDKSVQISIAEPALRAEGLHEAGDSAEEERHKLAVLATRRVSRTLLAGTVEVLLQAH